MTKRIFRAVLSISLLVCLIGMTTVFAGLYHYFDLQLTKELKSEAEYLAVSLETYGQEVLHQLPKSAERVTLIEKDGTVLFDNYTDAQQLDNHAQRGELKEAMEKGYAKTVRRSDTFQKRTVYYALRLEDGKILRVSSTQYTVAAVMAGMLQPFLWILFAVLMLAGLLAARISHKIVEHLNHLDLENPENNEVYDELAPLLTKIGWQQKTIRTQLEQAKQKQEEFQMITDNMKEGLLLIDHRGDILSINTSALEILGVSSELQIFVTNGKENVLTLNHAEAFRKTVDRVLEGKHRETVLEINGGDFQMTANPVLRENRVEGGVLLLVDITQQHQNEMLRREFTANVSHELKTPLTSISGFAEIMKDGFVRPEDIPQFAGKIFSESQRLIDLVGDIIKISQLDEDMLPYEKEEVDLRALSLEITERLQQRANKNNVSLSVSCVPDNGPVTVKTVRQIADEVIYNLCDNAIKYNRPNGSVEVIIEREKSQTVLRVKDTGIGIPAVDQRRVFERFYRVDKSHSKQIGGTGLGLSIVKHGAAYLGVKVGLESAVGQGSVFSLTWEENPPQENMKDGENRA